MGRSEVVSGEHGRRLPRAEWSAHANYPRQALLLSSHEAFRRMAIFVRERLDAIASDESMLMRQRARLLVRLRQSFADWMSSMASHERYEERKLYPFLVRRFGAEVDSLEAGHRELHELADAVELELGKAAALAREPEAAIGWPDAERAIGAHAARLLDHLEEEEDLVIPLLLSLDPEDFDAYARASAAEVLSLALPDDS